MARTYGAPNASNNNSGARANNNSNAKLIGVSIAGIAILGVLGVGGYFILGNKSDGNEQPSTEVLATVPDADVTENVITAGTIWSDITPNVYRTDSPNPAFTWIYCEAHYESKTNPSEKIAERDSDSIIGSLDNYNYIDEGYCNRNDITRFISVDEYEILTSEYESNVTNGLYSAYELGIPMKPFDPYALFVEEPLASTEDENFEEGEEISIDIENEEEIGPVANSYCVNGIETAGTEATRGKYHMHIIRGITRSSDGWFDYNDNNIDSATVEAYIASLEGTPISTDGNEGEEDNATTPAIGETYEVNKNFQYRHRLDGHVISYDEYRELCNKYRQDIDTYNSNYQSNYNMYH